jgi:AAA family ATP:ADP antiporter
VSSRTGRHQDRLSAALDHPHPDIRATAAVGLLAEASRPPAASAAMAAMLEGSLADRIALAQAIAYAPSEALRGTLAELLARGEPEVVREVLEVYVRAPGLAELERVLDLLEDFHVRAGARRVFLAAGDVGLDVLVAALHEPRTPPSVRRHVPRTLSRFGSPAAAAALIARLPHETDGTTELKILRALGRMHVDVPDLAVDRPGLRTYLRRALGEAARFATLLDHLAADPAPAAPATALLRQLLHEKRASAIERAFRTLDILHPGFDLRTVHDALTGADLGRRQAAREIAEAVVDVESRTAQFAVLDDLAPAERRARLGSLAAGPFRDHQAFVIALLSDPSESVRGVAAYHVAERRMVGLRDALIRARRRTAAPLVLHTFDQALAALDGAAAAEPEVARLRAPHDGSR